jgi:hypothetical protein
MTGLQLLKQQFNGHVAFRERRPGVIQVMAPLFHEDGDNDQAEDRRALHTAKSIDSTLPNLLGRAFKGEL